MGIDMRRPTQPGQDCELFLQEAVRGIMIDDQDIDETAFQCAMNGLELFRTVGNKNFVANQFKLV